MAEYKVTFIYEIKVNSEATMDFDESRESAIEKAREIHEKRIRDCGSIDAKISVHDLTWVNEIAPLINQKNRLITRLRKEEDGSPLPEGYLRRGIADQITEIDRDLEQYPQHRRQ